MAVRSERVVPLRERGLSIRQIAAEAGVSPMTVQRLVAADATERGPLASLSLACGEPTMCRADGVHDARVRICLETQAERDNGPATMPDWTIRTASPLTLSGNLYIPDFNNNCIRKVSNGLITTVAGNGLAGFSGDNGQATSAQLHSAKG